MSHSVLFLGGDIQIIAMGPLPTDYGIIIIRLTVFTTDHTTTVVACYQLLRENVSALYEIIEFLSCFIHLCLEMVRRCSEIKYALPSSITCLLL